MSLKRKLVVVASLFSRLLLRIYLTWETLRVKLCKTLKFLAFKEDNPKHRIIESAFTVEMLFVLAFPMVALFLGAVFLAFIYYGVAGAFIAYTAVVLLTLEVPHIIFDRESEISEEQIRDEGDLQILAKYFVHGILFSGISLAMAFVWAFIFVLLVYAFLSLLIWGIPVKTDWKSLLLHGFVLFVLLVIASIPSFILNLKLPSLATAVLLFIIYCFIDGFIAEKVGEGMVEM